MKRLKILLLSSLMLSGSAIMAQENDIEKVFKQKGDLIEATFYENGQVAQKGFYKDKELHGEWVAYDQNGNKKAIGKYSEGLKTGKWFFWNEEELSEVDFENNRIASVHKWKGDEGVVSK